jgi:hypothetical protein
LIRLTFLDLPPIRKCYEVCLQQTAADDSARLAEIEEAWRVLSGESRNEVDMALMQAVNAVSFSPPLPTPATAPPPEIHHSVPEACSSAKAIKKATVKKPAMQLVKPRATKVAMKKPTVKPRTMQAMKVTKATNAGRVHTHERKEKKEIMDEIEAE